MKKGIFICFMFCAFMRSLFGNGVGIVDGVNGVYLQLESTQIDINVENQVAVVTTTQTLRNNLESDAIIKYGFPLPENASALNLSWSIGGVEQNASIEPTPQDTTIPGTGDGETEDPNLITFLGETPLFFDIEQPIKPGSTIVVTLEYAELLSSEFGKVDFHYPNDYQLIQENVLNIQEIKFNLSSPRTIESVELLSSHPVDSQTNNGNLASIKSVLFETIANENYDIRYSLNLDELGLFGLSTLIPNESLPDEHGGFFLFVAEPDPSDTTDVISKVFTLIIDRSGSMSGDKIVQAKNAAAFIVNNLNEGDKFNIVDFASDVSSFRPSHVNFTTETQNDALDHIAAIEADGSTNISGAFDVAIPQFAAANETTANIIIFLTDGDATTGITDTQLLVPHISDIATATETNILLFTFGIGESVNEQLLTLLASQNNGLAEFLGDDELEKRITKFFLLINNPVLLDTEILFSLPGISEIYPEPLPNLFIGQQMIVSGRYLEPGDVEIALSGTAFGNPVEFLFPLELADSLVESNQFLPKIWAKQKIDSLLIKFNSLDPNLSDAEIIKQEIIDLSIAFGVVSPFTSFGQSEDDSEAPIPTPVGTPIGTPIGTPVPVGTSTPDGGSGKPPEGTPAPMPTATPAPFPTEEPAETLGSIEVDPETLSASSRLQVITVTALDINGNPMQGVTVKLEARGAGAVLGIESNVTGINGKAIVSGRFRFFSGRSAVFVITATDSDGNVVTVTITKN